MHIRVKKFAKPELSACGYFTDRPDLFAGKWMEQFSRKQPIHIELGCGKGVSTAGMVRDHPEINYIAIDMSPDILGVARRNMEQAFAPYPPDNIIFVRWNIDYIDQIFLPQDSIQRIVINFCNPWTQRAKHAKRRLTSPQKLMMYRSFLQDGGEIWFKTDNSELFADSLQYFQACAFDCKYQTNDLHSSMFSPNYVSEHEQLYTDKGIPIKFAIFEKNPRHIELDPKQWLKEWNDLKQKEKANSSTEIEDC